MKKNMGEMAIEHLSSTHSETRTMIS